MRAKWREEATKKLQAPLSDLEAVCGRVSDKGSWTVYVERERGFHTRLTDDGALLYCHGLMKKTDELWGLTPGTYVFGGLINKETSAARFVVVRKGSA